MGAFPEVTDVDNAEDDPSRPVRLVAHAVARLGDRFSWVRRFSRHMEGTERRAGILSDLFAAAYALYKRNPDAVEQLGKNFLAELHKRRKKADAKPQPTEVNQ